jgi:HSP20 family protein
MLVRTRHNHWLGNPFSSLAWGSPLTTFDALRRELDHVLSRSSGGFAPEYAEGAPSAFNFEERDDSYQLTAQVPGLSEKDLEITVTSDRLMVRGQRKVEIPEGYTKLRQERATYAFDKTVQLPRHVDVKHVEAKLANGILSIKLPKGEEAKPQSIKVLNA